MNKQTDAGSDIVNFISKSVVFFRRVELNKLVNLFISCGMTSPHIIDASDFAVRKVSFNPNTGRLSFMNLRLPGPVAGQTISVKVRCNSLFSGQ